MLKNYFKTAVRSLLKNKGFTLINLLGLATGLAACILILLYVFDELSYDRYNTKADRIYRVNEDLKLGNNTVKYAVAMAPLAQTLKADFPEVENTVRIKNAYSIHVKKGNENILEDKVGFADPSLFDVFTLPMINGQAATALKQPNSIVITESTAKKYFNSTDVVGKALVINDRDGFKVTGVIKDIPKTSHFNFDFFISMASFPDSKSDKWLRSDYNTYVLLKKGADYKKLEAQFPQLLRKYSGSEMENDLHVSIDQFEKGGSYFRMNLIPLTQIHLHSNLSGELAANSTADYIYIFSAIALFILIIACVNFMNLSTARSAGRAREVGVRKVLGSSRQHLIFQFLTESVLLTLVATVIALILAVLLLPAFGTLSGKELEFNTRIILWLLPLSLLIVIIVGFMAGSYPAFFLSAFNPVNVLKGRLAAGLKGGRLRSFLVVFQFSISIFLIIGTLVIYNQLHYIQNKNLGYSREQVLIVKNAYDLQSHGKLFKQQVKQLTGVSNATLTAFLPTTSARGTSIFYKDAAMLDQSNAVFPQTWRVDEDYIKTLDMKLVAGRDFSAQMGTDSAGLIINETAARFLGIKDPVNKNLYQSADGTRGNSKAYHIIGVVKDFNFSSLRENITPVIMRLQDDPGNLTVRLNTTNLPLLIEKIKSRWASLTPAKFEYSFMDADFDNTYRSEQRVGHLFVVFTILAIFIACLGLLGLAAYAAEQRTKEIGIRKILGANVSAIVAMLSKDFMKLVLIAIVVASPLALIAMHKWLQGFAYRESIHWWIVALAGSAAAIIAFATISFQSVKAALVNPVKSLKSE